MSPMNKTPEQLTNEQFAFAIKAHRERLNWTLKQTAELLKISVRALWKWEHCKGGCTHPTKVGALAILSAQ